MNAKVLASMKAIVESVSERLSQHFEIYAVNTSAPALGTPEKTCDAVAKKVLDWIEDELQEDILTLPQSTTAKAFKGKPSLDADSAQKLAQTFVRRGEYIPRSEVERDLRKVQALPIVVVRNKKGDILRLRRKEKKEDSALHKRIVIWAGGHVRKEDKQKGDPLVQCAVRELEEELRLAVEPDTLVLRGAIHSRVDEGTLKHVALVYEWQAKEEDVEVALSNAEFFERTGNALSGTFISAEQILVEHERGELTEEWSSQIVKNFLGETSQGARRDLFDSASS